jgi:hypothetical protein
VLPDGSIVLMAGYDGSNSSGLHDVWRSTDQGATWIQLTDAAEWSRRTNHTAAALSSGTLVLMGGRTSLSGGYSNEVWRLETDISGTRFIYLPLVVK